MSRRSKPSFFATAAVAALLTAGTGAAQARQRGAQTLYVNGNLYTPTGWKQAALVTNGKFVKVGSDAVVRKAAPTGVVTIDLGGATVLPALYDMHLHPVAAGLIERQCQFPQGAAAQLILKRVAECVKEKKPGEWITGGQWQAISLGDTPPTKEMLDEVAPNNPTVLRDISGHSSWVNSAALKAAKITAATPNPPAGVIERDSKGEPIGIMRETASTMMRDMVPPPSIDETAQAILYALTTLRNMGVRSVVDAGVDETAAKAYQQLSRQGRLPTNVRGCVVYGRAWGKNGVFDKLLANRASYKRADLALDCVKIYVDGVPTESHTAAMLEPYADVHGDTPSKAGDRGLLMLEPKLLNELVTRFDKMGMVVKFHAVGDQATRASLDAIEAARKANGPNGPTHDVGHLTFITLQDLGRAKALRATLEYSPYLWTPTLINEDIAKAVGPQRIERIWPVRDGVASGALVVAGSDWPSGTPSNNPWVGIETLLTRQRPGGSEESFGPKEAITLKQAVDIFTINAARQMGELTKRGSIEAGKIADVIVLDRNPFNIPVTTIHDVKVTQFIIDGKPVTVN